MDTCDVKAMMPSLYCRICLAPTHGDAVYHPACLEELYGCQLVPKINLSLAELHTVALAMVGKTSLSGVQRKISLGFKSSKRTLQIQTHGARYILKPQSSIYPELPENEHVSMLLAGSWGIPIPPCGLVSLQDNTTAYIVARFDRPSRGGKRHQEDFCQLGRLPPKDKYQGSSELSARLVLAFCSDPASCLFDLFRLHLFSWIIGNGDLHLKNISLTRHVDGQVRLTPAYDLVNTRLLISADAMALSVDGKKDNLTKKSWSSFARYSKISQKSIDREFQRAWESKSQMHALIGQSCLSAGMKEAYMRLVSHRLALLS